ncbi:phage tail tube protein [Stenotrophomonas sp.]|uniref:phage tail tube protein n=1 Tax=Stenotrophomonas sp. TaxID=69392 RepID=UPI0028AFDFDC|nr:phage tail tube protein [Stenotrophomonas sp.]
MALKFPKGTQFGFANLLSAAIAATTISKADPAAATVTTDAVDEGDVVLIEVPGWPIINNRVAQAGEVTAGASDSVILRGIDTSSAVLFPGASGAAKLFKAGDFVDFTQQGEPSMSGGEQQFWTGQMLEDPTGQQISVPTYKNARVLTIPLYYDPKLPWYKAAKEVDAIGKPVVLRAKLPGGDVQYRYGYLSFNGDPAIASNTPNSNTATFTQLSESTLVEAAE